MLGKFVELQLQYTNGTNVPAEVGGLRDPLSHAEPQILITGYGGLTDPRGTTLVAPTISHLQVLGQTCGQTPVTHEVRHEVGRGSGHVRHMGQV